MQDLHSIWNHRWVNPKVRSANSTIEGLGIFAADEIKKDETILVFGGVIIPTKDIEEYRQINNGPGHVGVQIDDEFFICPTSRKELEETGVVNHSCDPSAGFTNSIKIVAIKDISLGEEIVIDYAFCETAFVPFKCNCGSSNCRKEVTPNDWKIPELQKRYGQYFSPYLKAKISFS